jgi:hypothetical protein
MPTEPNPTPPAQDTGFRARHLPGTQAGESKGMLPGMALIGMFLLLIAMLNAFAAIRGAFGMGAARYSILTVCTLLIVGVFGLLSLRRWGWSLTTAGCLLMAAGYFYGFHRVHSPSYIVNGLFDLVFFLYLSRPEVRDRLR